MPQICVSENKLLKFGYVNTVKRITIGELFDRPRASFEKRFSLCPLVKWTTIL